MKFNYSSDAVTNDLFYMTPKHDAKFSVLLYIKPQTESEKLHITLYYIKFSFIKSF